MTVITSSRSGTVQNTDSATVRLHDNGRISDISIVNDGSGSTFGIGVWSADATRAAVIDNAVIEANTARSHSKGSRRAGEAPLPERSDSLSRNVRRSACPCTVTSIG